MDRLEQFISDLLDINPNIDIGLIENAYTKADQMHAGQLRKSLEPYIIHPIEVAKILADLGMDDTTIAAGLLHDAVEDTPYSIEELQKDFGVQVAFLVNGVTKLGNLVYDSKEERQAENLRKMFLAISKDIRVLIIKLADRLHNLRTINYMSREQIVGKCNETLEIYAPLASRLGIYTVKFELEDIALKYLDPEAYYGLANELTERKEEREKRIGKVIGQIRDAIDEYNIKYEITGRSKHFYSIYMKMREQDKTFDEIFDLSAVRIIVETVQECYTVLGAVHTLWRPMPGRFKDYIAMPKPNMYQSIHTTLIGEGGTPFEVQIRTEAMHRVAEYGIAAHWKYKEGISDAQDDDVKIAWIRQTLEWNKDMDDPREYIEAMKTDLFSNQVFVFTPKGDVIELPAGSTPLDFAFKIHSDIGIHCIGARVNSKMAPIDYVLQNGEVVEIVTSRSTKGPSMDWLNIAKSASAKSKIRQWLKKQDRSQNIERGRAILEKSVKRKGYGVEDIVRAHWLAKIAKQMNYLTVNELYMSLSHGGAIVSKVIAKLAEMYQDEYDRKAAPPPEPEEKRPAPPKPKRERKETPGDTRILAEGLEGMLVRLSRCCSPVPGDEIVGFITIGRGVSVHRADCPNIKYLKEADRSRLIAVDWDKAKWSGDYNADINIFANDRKGLFSDISKACLDMDVNISGVNLKTNEDKTVSISMTLMVSNASEMTKILKSLRRIDSVLEVYRAKG